MQPVVISQSVGDRSIVQLCRRTISLIQIGAKGDVLRLDEERGQELGVHVPGVPDSNGQLVVGLDLRGKLPDVTKPDAELVVSSATLSVLRTDLLVAERFQLRESILQSHRLFVALLESEIRDNRTRFSGGGRRAAGNRALGAFRPDWSQRCDLWGASQKRLDVFHVGSIAVSL